MNTVKRIKSPSDTTIYAPVLNKTQQSRAMEFGKQGTQENMNTDVQISMFLEQVRATGDDQIATTSQPQQTQQAQQQNPVRDSRD